VVGVGALMRGNKMDASHLHSLVKEPAVVGLVADDVSGRVQAI
jgi:hypothetical protein